MTETRKQCLKALDALYLEVPAVIADDVKRRVLAALDEADRLTTQRVGEIFSDGVYAHPEFHKLEAENGTVTKQVQKYLEEYMAKHDTPQKSLRDELVELFLSLHDNGYIEPFDENEDAEQKAEEYVSHYLKDPKRNPSIGAMHMTDVPVLNQLFKPFKDGGCEFIYGSPPRDEQCTRPPMFEIKSTIVGRSSGGRYLVCDHHKDELFHYIKEFDEDATIEPLP